MFNLPKISSPIPPLLLLSNTPHDLTSTFDSSPLMSTIHHPLVRDPFSPLPNSHFDSLFIGESPVISSRVASQPLPPTTLVDHQLGESPSSSSRVTSPILPFPTLATSAGKSPTFPRPLTSPSLPSPCSPTPSHSTSQTHSHFHAHPPSFLSSSPSHDSLPFPSFIAPHPPITLISSINPPTHSVTTRSKYGIFKPNLKYSLVASYTSHISPLPRSYLHAQIDPNWKCAMDNEYDALIKNDTWELVPHPTNANVLRCMWLFKHKFKSDGFLERYKACLLVNGKQ